MTNNPENPKPEDIGALARSSRVGFDFVVTVFAGAVLGWCIDWGFNTAPWGIVGMTLVGFASGLRNLWRALEQKKMGV